MKRPINLSQADLDELGARADQLGEWLEEQDTAPDHARNAPIPPHLTVIASAAVLYGLPIILKATGPSSLCWGGGCIG